MGVLKVKTASGEYEVLIEKGAADVVGSRLRTVGDGGKAAIITDDNVMPLYLDRINENIKKAGFETYVYVLPHGESSKNGCEYLKILEFLAQSELDRHDNVIALGGGVVGDIAGYAAATYLRGIGFIQIPTTLLSMVDSSVGGKTAVDLKAGKNLAGAFWQPKFVAIDTDFLKTLPESEIKNGLGEILKYAVISGGGILRMLEDGFGKHVSEIVEASVNVKRRIVEADEKESGLRRILNFGHTPAHAAEKLSGYSLSHGVCVAAGVNVMLRASVRKAGCPACDAERIAALSRKYALPVSFAYSPGELAAASVNDKKSQGGFINLVLAEKIGSVFSEKVPLTELEEYFR